MSTDLERRRVLIAAAPGVLASLLRLFDDGLVEGWEAGEAESFEQARFVLQHDLYDVLLLDHSVYRPEEMNGLDWLSRQQPPVAYLARPDARALAAVLERGASQWLPRDLGLSHPPLLAAVLNQAAARGDQRRQQRQVGEALLECRRQVRRLVTLLWGLSPTQAHPRWFTQRHMMERLQEEIARAQRYGTPLSLVIGEVRAGDDTPLPRTGPRRPPGPRSASRAPSAAATWRASMGRAASCCCWRTRRRRGPSSAAAGCARCSRTGRPPRRPRPAPSRLTSASAPTTAPTPTPRACSAGPRSAWSRPGSAATAAWRFD